jgi:hypothetical protein
MEAIDLGLAKQLFEARHASQFTYNVYLDKLLRGHRLRERNASPEGFRENIQTEERLLCIRLAAEYDHAHTEQLKK